MNNSDKGFDPGIYSTNDVPWHDIEATGDLSNLRSMVRSMRFGPWRIFFQDLAIHCHDLLSFYYSARDIFLHRLYDFGQLASRSRIIDGGAHIGLFSLYAANHAPDALIQAFEPNPLSLRLLRLNIESNGLVERVQVVPSGLGAIEGKAFFSAGQSDDSSFHCGQRQQEVSMVRLGDWLDVPVAVLKLNVEGAECEVMKQAAGRLNAVDKVFIEYHGFPELPQTLHRILAVLDAAGFRYCLGAMDAETNPACHPPYSLGGQRFFNIIYAERQRGQHCLGGSREGEE